MNLGIFAAYDFFIKRNHLPKILKFEYIRSKLICLTEPSEVFSFGTIVSIYHKREGFESLIAAGEVYNIQEDGKIQIKIYNSKVNQDEFEKMITNNADMVNNLLIKPNIPKDYINYL